MYRACYYHSSSSRDDIVLTAPKHAELSNHELTRLAIRRAYEANIVGDGWPWIPLDDLKAGLRIGRWKKN